MLVLVLVTKISLYKRILMLH